MNEPRNEGAPRGQETATDPAAAPTRFSSDWWKQVLSDYVIYLGLVVVLAAAASLRNGWVILIASVLVLIALIVVRRRGRPETRNRPLVGVLLAVAGIVLIWVWWNYTRSTDMWGFIGFATAAFGYGILIHRWRAWCRDRHDQRCRWIGLGLIALGGAGLAAVGFVLVTYDEGVRRWMPWLIIVSLFTIIVGLSVLAEASVALLDSRNRRIIVAVVGGVILAASMSVLIWMGAPWLFALVLVLVLTGLTAALVSNTDADVFVLLLVVALVWVITPHNAPAPEPLAAETSRIVVVGDSYISGEGAKRFYEGTNLDEGNGCRRAPTAYGVLLTELGLEEIPSNVTFVACSAARGRHIHRDAQYSSEPPSSEGGLHQLDHLAHLGASSENTAVVFVSIGGNDAGFGRIATACVLPGDCSTIGDRFLGGLESVGPVITEALVAVKDHFGDSVTVVAVPYPIPLNEDGCDSSALSRDEHRFLHGFANEMNNVVEVAAATAGVHVLVPMRNSLTGELRLCDGDDDVGVNFIALRSVEGVASQRLNPVNWFHNSLHPNERGHEAMAETAKEWIEDFDWAAASPNPVAAGTFSYEVATIEELMGSDFQYCGNAPESLSYCEKDDTNSWTTAQSVATGRRVLPFFLLMLLGAWLISLAIVATYRGVGSGD